MRKALALFVLLTVGAAAGAWLVASKLGPSDTALSSLAPKESIVYVEAPNLTKALEQLRATEAAKDFTRSKTYEEFGATWQKLVELAEKGEGPLARLKKLQLPLTEVTALRFAGQGAALGIVPPVEGGPPALYGVTKIDLAGLAKDLAANSEDWLEVWSKLRERLSPEGKTEDFNGFQIVSRKVKVKGEGEDAVEVEIFFSQAHDMVFGSTQKAPVQAFIKAHLGQEQGLAGRKGFDAIAKLPSEDLIARGWVDFDYFRDGAKVKTFLTSLAKETGASEKDLEQMNKEFTGEEFKVFAAQTKPLAGLAAGVYFEGGSPYAVKVEASHSAEEVFNDASSLPAESVAGAEPSFYVEVPRLGATFGEVMASKGWKLIADSAAFKWVEEKLEKDPKALAQMTGERGLEQVATHDPRFELRTALAAMDLYTRELFGDRLIASATVGEMPKQPKEGETPELPVDFAVVSTLRPLPRMIVAVIAGAAEAHADQAGIKVEEIAGTKVYQIGRPGSMEFACVAQAGMDLVITNKPERMAKLLAKETSPSSNLSAMRKTLSGTPGALVYYDLKQMTKAMMLPMMGRQGGGELEFHKEYLQDLKQQESEAEESMKDFYRQQIKETEARIAELEAAAANPPEDPIEKMGLEGQALLAFHIPDDYTHIRIQSVQRSGGKLKDYVSKIYPDGLEVEDAHLARLPYDSFFGFAMRHDLKKAYDGFKTLLGEEPFQEFERGLKEEAPVKVDLEADFLAHAGDWSALSVVSQPNMPMKDAPEGMPQVAVPALVAMMAYKGEGFEKRFLEIANEFLHVSLSRSGPGGEGMVVGQLRTITTAQALFREGDKDENGTLDYADSLDALIKTDLVYMPESDYVFVVKRSKANPEFCWMATASPKSGKGKHYAVTHEGVVYHAWKAFEFNDACEVPEGSVHFGAELGPPPADTGEAPAAPKPSMLEKLTVDGVEIYKVKMPKGSEREFGPAGEGFGPCLAFHEGALVISTSQYALLQSLKKAKGGVVAQPTFQRISKPLTKRGTAFTFFEVAGVIDLVLANAEMIAKEAAPLPPELKDAPEYPEYREPPENLSGEELNKFYEEQQKEQEAWDTAYTDWRNKGKEWREKNAAANAKAMEKILSSLKVLGGMVSNGWQEGDLAHGEFVWSLDEGK